MFRTPKSFAPSINNNKNRMDSVDSIEKTTTGVMTFVALLLTWNGEYVGLIGLTASIAAYYFINQARAQADLVEQYFASEELHAIKDIRLAQEAYKTVSEEVVSLNNGNTVVRCLYILFGLILPALFMDDVGGAIKVASYSYAVVALVNSTYGYLTLARINGNRPRALTVDAMA